MWITRSTQRFHDIDDGLKCNALVGKDNRSLLGSGVSDFAHAVEEFRRVGNGLTFYGNAGLGIDVDAQDGLGRDGRRAPSGKVDDGESAGGSAVALGARRACWRSGGRAATEKADDRRGNERRCSAVLTRNETDAFSIADHRPDLPEGFALVKHGRLRFHPLLAMGLHVREL